MRASFRTELFPIVLARNDILGSSSLEALPGTIAPLITLQWVADTNGAKSSAIPCISSWPGSTAHALNQRTSASWHGPFNVFTGPRPGRLYRHRAVTDHRVRSR
jgi:hypothetical protein